MKTRSPKGAGQPVPEIYHPQYLIHPEGGNDPVPVVELGSMGTTLLVKHNHGPNDDSPWNWHWIRRTCNDGAALEEAKRAVETDFLAKGYVRATPLDWFRREGLRVLELELKPWRIVDYVQKQRNEYYEKVKPETLRPILLALQTRITTGNFSRQNALQQGWPVEDALLFAKVLSHVGMLTCTMGHDDAAIAGWGRVLEYAWQPEAARSQLRLMEGLTMLHQETHFDEFLAGMSLVDLPRFHVENAVRDEPYTIQRLWLTELQVTAHISAENHHVALPFYRYLLEDALARQEDEDMDDRIEEIRELIETCESEMAACLAP